MWGSRPPPLERPTTGSLRPWGLGPGGHSHGTRGSTRGHADGLTALRLGPGIPPFYSTAGFPLTLGLRQMAQLGQGEGRPLGLCKAAAPRFPPHRSQAKSYMARALLSSRTVSLSPCFLLFPHSPAHSPGLALCVSPGTGAPKRPTNPVDLTRLEVKATNDHSLLFIIFFFL